MNIKDFPKTSDTILNYENGWLDIHLNNVENRNALKQNLIKELVSVLFPAPGGPVIPILNASFPFL